MLKKVSLSLIIFILLITLPTFISIGDSESGNDISIYLISSEIHTDLVLPVKNEVFNWEEFYDPSVYKSRPVDWIQVGWGDKEFYLQVPTWNEFTLVIGLDALFLPGPSAMHVSYLKAHPRLNDNIREIKVSRNTYKELVMAIRNSFKLEKGKPVLLPGKGYSSTDNFYEAHGSFSVLNTCNVWTSNILSEAGLKHPLWSPTKYGLEFAWGL